MIAESPIRTVLRVKMGGRVISVPLEPGQMAKFDLPARGVRELYGYAYLLSRRSHRKDLYRRSTNRRQPTTGISVRFCDSLPCRLRRRNDNCRRRLTSAP